MKKKMMIALMAVMLLCSSCQAKLPPREVSYTNQVLATKEVFPQDAIVCALKIYGEPINLVEESELVVLATSDVNRSIADYENRSVSNCTNFTIDQVFYGQTDEEVITVFESGGVIPYLDYRKMFGDEINIKHLGKYVEFKIDSGPFIQDHKQYVLFLRKDESENKYYTVSSSESRYRYILNEEGGFSDAFSDPQFTLEQITEFYKEYQNS